MVFGNKDTDLVQLIAFFECLLIKIRRMKAHTYSPFPGQAGQSDVISNITYSKLDIKIPLGFRGRLFNGVKYPVFSRQNGTLLDRLKPV